MEVRKQNKRGERPRRHTDGSVCLEGTKSVPEGYAPCCESFDYRTTRCAYDIRFEYWKERDIWVIPIVDSAGGGGIEISYCPHCGAQLSKSSKPPGKSGGK
jgi:hypothetical protein